jgi:hypothetical protein
MMKSRYATRRLDPYMLLPALVIQGVMMTSAVGADESFFRKPSFKDLQDGEITLAGAEHGRAGIHMSFLPLSELDGNSDSVPVVTDIPGIMPDVYLSLRVPW